VPARSRLSCSGPPRLSLEIGMSATLTLITRMDNGFTRRIQKEREFIGMDGLGFNLMIQLKPQLDWCRFQKGRPRW
jgi:hypothetical protein